MNKRRCILVVTVLFSLIGLALPQESSAAWEPVLEQGSVCDTSDRVCFQGSIDFDPNKKVIEIRGRLYKTAGEGVLTFEFTGETPLGENVFHPATVNIQGRYSESISHKLGPPYSNQTDWSLYRLTFTPTDER